MTPCLPSQHVAQVVVLYSTRRSTAGAFEDTESALCRAAGTRTFPSLLALQEEPVFWKPEPVVIPVRNGLHSSAATVSLRDGTCLRGTRNVSAGADHLEDRGPARCGYRLTTASCHSCRLLHPGDLRKLFTKCALPAPCVDFL